MKRDNATLAVFAGLLLLFVWSATGARTPWDRARSVGEPAADAPAGAATRAVVTHEREAKAGECPNKLARIALPPDAARLVPPEEFHTVRLAAVSETLRANAETRYPPDRYARVAPRIAGVVRTVRAILGQAVEAGAPLATIESPAFGQIKADFLQARDARDVKLRLFETEKGLHEKKVTPERDFLEAKTACEQAGFALREAEQRLAWSGLSPAQIEAIAAARDASPLLDVAAPFAGQVVEASAVLGETAVPEKPIFSVADGARMWIVVDVYEADLARVEKDQRVVFLVEGLPGKRFPGKVVAIGGEVDDRTRTVRVFADVKNLGGLLRANMFGSAEISVRPAAPRILVPKTAVQNDGDCDLVFVATAPNAFQAREVELGAVYEGGYEVVRGLAEGEKIATTGSFLLKTEILRGQIGAG